MPLPCAYKKELIKFMIEKTKDRTAPLSLRYFARDFLKIAAVARQPRSVEKVCRRLMAKAHLLKKPTLTKVRILFVLSGTVCEEFKAEMDEIGTYTIDSAGHIETFHANDGSLSLVCKHNASGTRHRERSEKEKPEKAESGSDSDEEEDMNVVEDDDDTIIDRYPPNNQPPTVQYSNGEQKPEVVQQNVPAWIGMPPQNPWNWNGQNQDYLRNQMPNQWNGMHPNQMYGAQQPVPFAPVTSPAVQYPTFSSSNTNNQSILDTPIKSEIPDTSVHTIVKPSEEPEDPNNMSGLSSSGIASSGGIETISALELVKGIRRMAFAYNLESLEYEANQRIRVLRHENKNISQTVDFSIFIEGIVCKIKRAPAPNSGGTTSLKEFLKFLCSNVLFDLEAQSLEQTMQGIKEDAEQLENSGDQKVVSIETIRNNLEALLNLTRSS